MDLIIALFITSVRRGCKIHTSLYRHFMSEHFFLNLLHSRISLLIRPERFRGFLPRCCVQIFITEQITNDSAVRPIQGVYKWLSGQASFGKKYNCAAFSKQMPNFNLLLTVTSDINSVPLAPFNPVFVPYIRFITVNKLQICPVLELNKICDEDLANLTWKCDVQNLPNLFYI
jgi:hypothetical protein